MRSSLRDRFSHLFDLGNNLSDRSTRLFNLNTQKLKQQTGIQEMCMLLGHTPPHCPMHLL